MASVLCVKTIVDNNSPTYVNVLIKFYLVRYFGLVLEAGENLELLPRIREFQLDGGVVFLVLKLGRVGEVLVGCLVAQEDLLFELDRGAELAACLGFDAEEEVLEGVLHLVASHTDRAACIRPLLRMKD